MARYIDADKVLEICEKHYQHCLEMHDYCGDATADNIKEDIEKLPTADVVEVVRCRECKKCDCSYPVKAKGEEALEGWYCNTFRQWRSFDDFCSYGERKQQ